MPSTDPSFNKDIQLLKLRGVIDPKRHCNLHILTLYLSISTNNVHQIRSKEHTRPQSQVSLRWEPLLNVLTSITVEGCPIKRDARISLMGFWHRKQRRAISRENMLRSSLRRRAVERLTTKPFKRGEPAINSNSPITYFWASEGSLTLVIAQPVFHFPTAPA